MTDDLTYHEPAATLGTGGFVRLRLDLAYDGTDFSGWARQPGRRTVQETVESALATVLRLDPPPRTVVAGRTDAGVHAAAQVAHVDLDPTSPALLRSSWERLAARLTRLLPDDVVVRSLAPAPAGFDARFAAIARHYRYRATDVTPDPLRRHDTLAVRRPLDVPAMAVAASHLVGEHDFRAFARPRPGATSVRTLLRLDVGRRDDAVEIEASGDAFCHHQVRFMVGALLAVGDGRRTPDWVATTLASKERDADVVVVPARGLTLVGVDYPADDGLAAQAVRARQQRPEPQS